MENVKEIWCEIYKRVESRLWKEAGLKCYRCQCLTEAWDFLLQFSLCCKHCVLQASPNARVRHCAVWEKLWLEPQNAGAAVHLDGHPGRSTDKEKQPRESEDRSKFLTSQQQGLGKPPELQTNNSVLPLHLALSPLCHIPKREMMNRYIWTTYRRGSLRVWGRLDRGPHGKRIWGGDHTGKASLQPGSLLMLADAF